MGDLEQWGEVAKKYDIHQETLAYFRTCAELGLKPYDEMTPEEMRGVTLRRSEYFGGHADFEGSEKQFVVPSQTNPAGVPMSVYKPSISGSVPAIWVYFHGGGLATGSRNSYAPALKVLASRAVCLVVNVEYRLAPENKAPAAFDDCRCVTQWVVDNKVLIGGHHESAVGVGGDSAGGQLAASVAHDVRSLDFQVLVYPFTDGLCSLPSFAEFASTPGLNQKSIDWFMGNFIADESQKRDPVVFATNRPNSSFVGLPPALCILAQLDPLRDDGIEYCQKMKEAGVAVETLLVKGAPHVFFHLMAHFKELTKEAHDRCVTFLKQFQKS